MCTESIHIGHLLAYDQAMQLNDISSISVWLLKKMKNILILFAYIINLAKLGDKTDV